MVITDYCSMDKTLLYIKRVCKLKNSNNINIIVVDNSTIHHGIKTLLSCNIPFSKKKLLNYDLVSFYINDTKISMVSSIKNGGYSAGNNLGYRISKAIYPKNNYTIFCNNDIFFDKNLDLKKVKQIFTENNDIGIIGPNILSKDGNKQNPRKDMSFLSQMIVWNINIMLCRGVLNRYVWNLDTNNDFSKKTGWVSGSFMIVRNLAFEEVNGFDTETFLYGEEMILSQKMRNSGYSTYYFPKITIIHAHQGATPSKKQRLWNYESKRYYYKKYKGIKEWKLKISDYFFNLVEFLYELRHLNQ